MARAAKLEFKVDIFTTLNPHAIYEYTNTIVKKRFQQY